MTRKSYSLTKTEKTRLKEFIAQGFRTLYISQSLGLSVSTVKYYKNPKAHLARHKRWQLKNRDRILKRMRDKYNKEKPRT